MQVRTVGPSAPLLRRSELLDHPSHCFHRDQFRAEVREAVGSPAQRSQAFDVLRPPTPEGIELPAGLAQAQAQAAPVEFAAPAPVVSTGQRILDAATTRVGSPYVWGATGPNSFDCSGLTSWAYKEAGISIPRTSQAQIGGGTQVSKADLQPGDIVAFYSGASHVGIYAGNGQVVHAPYSGTSVSYAPVDSMPFYGATRYY